MRKFEVKTHPSESEGYTIPNYLHQWLSEDNPIKHLKQNQINAYYLYKTRLDALSERSGTIQSVAEIADICGITPASVRRNYKNMEAAGCGPIVMELYQSHDPQRKQTERKAFAPDILVLYDAFCSNLQQPPSSRKTLAQFLCDYNASHGSNLKYRNILYYFKEIEKADIRSKRPI